MADSSPLTHPRAGALQAHTIVTGSGGYLGSNMALALAKAGARVLGVQRTVVEHPPFEVIKADLSRPGALDSVLTPESIVFHFASTSSVAASVADPRREFTNNLQVAFEVLESVRKANCRIVYPSSICVADPDSPLPHSERAPLSPRSPYGMCKAAGELFASTYFHTYGTDVRIARIGTVYGPHLRRFAIYDFYRKLCAEPTRLEILGDGNQLRDYLYIEDAISALMLLAFKGSAGEIYNVGSGSVVTSKELGAAVATAMGLPEPEIVPLGKNFQGDIPRWELDIGKLRQLGFTHHTSMNIGLSEVVKSYKGSKDLIAC